MSSNIEQLRRLVEAIKAAREASIGDPSWPQKLRDFNAADASLDPIAILAEMEADKAKIAEMWKLAYKFVDFRCPECGGSHFGSTCTPEGGVIEQQCHDEFIKGCKWRGLVETRFTYKELWEAQQARIAKLEAVVEKCKLFIHQAHHQDKCNVRHFRSCTCGKSELEYQFSQLIALAALEGGQQ